MEAFRSLRRATKGAAFGNRKLLKKFDQNFEQKLFLPLAFPFQFFRILKELFSKGFKRVQGSALQNNPHARFYHAYT